MIKQPVIIPARLPAISAMYGVIGRATMLPTDMIAFKRPRVAALGLWNAVRRRKSRILQGGRYHLQMTH